MKLPGQELEDVVEPVADVADAEAGAFADFAVFEVFVVFQADQFLIGFIQFGDEESEMTFRFQFAQRFIGRFPGRRGFGGHFSDHFQPVIAPVIRGAIPNAPIQPRDRLPDIVPMLMQLEERVLDDLLRDLTSTDQPERIAKQLGLLRLEHRKQPRLRLGSPGRGTDGMK
jgi:hypothetical protein